MWPVPQASTRHTAEERSATMLMYVHMETESPKGVWRHKEVKGVRRQRQEEGRTDAHLVFECYPKSYLRLFLILDKK